MTNRLRRRTIAVFAAMLLAASAGGVVLAEENAVEETAPEISVVDIIETPNESMGGVPSD